MFQYNPAQTKFKREREPLFIFLTGSALVTLFFLATLIDPFNAPKSWILMVGAAYMLGWTVFQIKPRLNNQIFKWASSIAGLYIFALFLTWLATESKYLGFFGEYQRRTGLISYVSLVVLFLSGSFLISLKSITKLENAGLASGLLVGVYGFAQHVKIDPIKWNNPYNSVLSTLGNPDFAAAVMAILAVISFGIAIQSKKPTWMRVLAGANVILLFADVLFAQVRQGLLAGVAGISVVLLVWVYQRKKMLGHLFSGAIVLVGLFGILGMLNMGPLTKYFYKMSVTYRGDYWRAGWRMFKSHPIFGVGLDRYGAYFRQYRDAIQVARRGPDLVSNAAHNIPIQLAATGGIVLLLAYLIFTLFIAWRAIVALRQTSGSNQIVISVIVGAWVAYQLQSMISIDNLGISIWGYVLGGAIVGLSVIVNEKAPKLNPNHLLQPVVSGVLTAGALIVCALFYQSEVEERQFTSYQLPKNQTDLNTYKNLGEKSLSHFFKEPYFVLTNGKLVAQAGDLNDGLNVIKGVADSDSRDYEARRALASIYEFQKNWQAAIAVRREMVALDPINQLIIDQLNNDIKAAG